MKIYYDLDLQSQVVQGTAANVKKPVLYYGTAPFWELVITAGGAAADLSGIAAWRASVDVDFSKDSSPVCRSLADRIDLRDAASGIVRVQLLTLTTEFLAALNREKQRNGYFELQALNGDGYAEFIIQIPVVLTANCVTAIVISASVTAAPGFRLTGRSSPGGRRASPERRATKASPGRKAKRGIPERRATKASPVKKAIRGIPERRATKESPERRVIPATKVIPGIPSKTVLWT